MILLRCLVAIGLILATSIASAAPTDPCTEEPRWANDIKPRFTIAIDPGTQWQPQSGFYRFTLEGQGIADIRSLRVCMRWHGATTWQFGRELHLESADVTRAVYTVRLPARLDVPAGFAPESEGQVARLAQLRVEARDDKDIVLFDEALRVGVTRTIYGYAAGAVAALLVLAFGLLVSRDIPGPTGFLKIIGRRDGTASLSQLQILLWTLVIGAGSIHVMVISGNLLHLSTGTLVLLGIAGVASLGASLHAGQGAPANPAPANPAPANPAPANPAPANPTPVPATRRIPKWSDLVTTGQGADAEIDITRVQMLFFTVISAVFVLLMIAERQVVPDIPEEYLLLMGISNGVYLSAKFVSK